MGAGNHSLLIYVICFFIYLNVKIGLFLGFYEYAKKMISKYKREANSDKVDEIAEEIEARKWYETSVFKKVSKLEYNSEMGSMMRSFRKMSRTTEKANNKNEAKIILEKPHYDNTLNPNDIFSNIT